VPPCGAEWGGPMHTYTLAHGPGLIGLVPHLIGYLPQDSLVLVTAQSTASGSGALGASLRMDFDHERAARLDEAALETMLRPLDLADGADTVFPVLFSAPVAVHHTGLDALTADTAAARALLDGLSFVCDGLAARGFDVVQPLWAGEEMCGRVGEHGGTPLARARETPAVVGMIAEGSRAAESFEDCVRAPEALPAHAAEIEQLREGTDDEEAARALLRTARTLTERAQRRAEAHERPAPFGPPEPAAVLALDRFLPRLPDRDWVQMLLSGDHPGFSAAALAEAEEDGFLAHARRAGALPGAAQELVGFCPRPPRLWALAEAVDWLRGCLPYIGAEARPGLYALLAWFEWSRVRMRFAEHYALAALEADGDHRLAQLVLRAVRAGLPPVWAQRE
jgi:hypothetical protein